MESNQIFQMKDFSEGMLEQIRELEQCCKAFDASGLRVGIESLREEDGDFALLCFHENVLVGFLSWYTPDGMEASVNGMVHPDFRRQGIFSRLLREAAAGMSLKSIQTCRFKVPADSGPGLAYIHKLGARFQEAEFSMLLGPDEVPVYNPESTSRLPMKLALEGDLDFIVPCYAVAFGDSEAWVKEYFAHTNERNRETYVVMDAGVPIGIIRVKQLDRQTAFIHDFCVRPDVQGKGYGRRILAQTVQLLRDRECGIIRLGVVTENDRALKLYQSVGFSVSSEFHYYVMDAADMGAFAD